MKRTVYARRLTDEEKAALLAYAEAHGRTWKQQLRWAWMDAAEPGILQCLRNSATFGPDGLNRVTLADLQG